MAQNIATTEGIDALVDGWIEEGRFANRSEAFRAGIFALQEKLDRETFDPDFVAVVRELDRHSGGEGEPTGQELQEIGEAARRYRQVSI
jgi:Arc/MetJ-type ribon-helix-helix transcriptional regulator